MHIYIYIYICLSSIYIYVNICLSVTTKVKKSHFEWLSAGGSWIKQICKNTNSKNECLNFLTFHSKSINQWVFTRQCRKQNVQIMNRFTRCDTHTHTHTHTHTRIHAHMHIHTHAYTYTRIHTHTYTHTHTHRHTQTHRQTHSA